MLALVQAGVIDYHAFDRLVEQVVVDRDLAIAMGAETVRPKAGPHAGATIVHRYTNVWRKGRALADDRAARKRGPTRRPVAGRPAGVRLPGGAPAR